MYTSYTPLFPASQALLLTTSPHKLLKCLVFQAHFSEARGCTFQRNQRQFPGLRQKILNTGCMDKQEVVGLIEAAIDEIRPYLQSDGGDITIVEVSDDLVVKVRLEGACDGCPMSMQTLKNGVEMVVKTRVPAVLEVVAV
jgi:Fe-S cluster biogenesis protein NfuA